MFTRRGVKKVSTTNILGTTLGWNTEHMAFPEERSPEVHEYHYYEYCIVSGLMFRLSIQTSADTRLFHEKLRCHRYGLSHDGSVPQMGYDSEGEKA